MLPRLLYAAVGLCLLGTRPERLPVRSAAAATVASATVPPVAAAPAAVPAHAKQAARAPAAGGASAVRPAIAPAAPDFAIPRIQR